MAEVPAFADAGVVIGLKSFALAEFQLAAYIVVEGGDIGRGDGCGLWVVIGLFRQQIDRGAREAGVDATGGAIIEQVLLEDPAGNRIGRAFEVDMTKSVADVPLETFQTSFRIAGPGF